MSSNLVLGFPIYSDAGVLYTPAISGGSWSSDLPLSNLLDRALENVARSADALAASTTLDIDLGVARAVRVLALPKTNLTAAATVKWEGGTSAGANDVYNSTALAVSWSATTAEDRDGINCAVVHVPATAKTARYWRVSIVDTANPDGYVQLARLVIAAGYQPTINMKVGAKLGLRDATVRTESDGAAAKYQVKPVRRTMTFALPMLGQAEAFASAFKIQRQAGKSKQLFFVLDPDDTTYMHERAFLGTLEELGDLDFAKYLYHDNSFRIVEEL